jgi:branched-chain amino acid aminotransferase
MQLSIHKADTLKPKPADDELGFGKRFTDHMLKIHYTPNKGWHNPRIEPYGPLPLDPATMMLHYGQAVFEGLKAYRSDAGNIQMFRPQENFKRLNRSCTKLCIPQLDETLALNSLKELLRLEADWVPKSRGSSLYIRPTILATDPYLGVRASETYLYYVILSPVGAYYSAGFDPVKIEVTKEHVRAVRGGIGEAKTPGNYAASLFAGMQAAKRGYAQVLWLDGVEQKYVEEVGSMNIFFVIDDTVITPALNGSILPGITRMSVLELLTHWGVPAKEERISIEEVAAAQNSGRLKEVFGAGTAAVISPVGALAYADETLTIGDGTVGPISQKLFNAIMDIQYGKTEDPFGWIEPV